MDGWTRKKRASKARTECTAPAPGLKRYRSLVTSRQAHFTKHHHTGNPTIHPPTGSTTSPSWTNLLLGLEVVQENGALLGLLTPVLDNDARAVDDLAGVALAVKGA